MRSFLIALCTAARLVFGGEVSSDINAFSFALYKPLSGKDANVIYSPLSLFCGLSMVASGSAGSTRQALERGLKWSSDRRAIAKNLAALSSSLMSLNVEKDCKHMSLANALYLEQDTPVLPAFKSVIEESYEAEIETLDFGNSAQALQIINAWVGNQTHQKIKDLLQPGDINSSTRLLLVNALYYLGAWQKPFNKKLTQKQPFKIDEVNSIDTPMMRQKGSFRYFEDPETQVAIIPLCSTASASPAFVIVLPKDSSNMAEMSSDLLNSYLTSSNLKTLDLKIPVFCLRKRYDMQNALSSLGMGIAFTSQANFSDIDGMQDLFLSKALHEGYIDVNESGIEAAAATAGVIGVTAVPAEKPIFFTADHPFLFFLIDETSKAILFAGKFSDPNLSACVL